MNVLEQRQAEAEGAEKKRRSVRKPVRQTY